MAPEPLLRFAGTIRPWPELLKCGFYWGFIGAPGPIRTADLLVRSQTLYPTELRAQCRQDTSNVPDRARRSQPRVAQ
jgi:hypothetical protein